MSAIPEALPTGAYSHKNSYVDLPLNRFSQGAAKRCYGRIVQEVELHVSVDGRYIHTLTCSPWDIEELAVGYLFSKSIVKNQSDISGICVDEEKGLVEVTLHRQSAQQEATNIVQFEDAKQRGVHKRPRYLDTKHLSVVKSSTQLSEAQVHALACMLESDSLLFKSTGGVHSAILVNNQEILAWFEDIGRHSAVDKLAGWCVLNAVSTTESVLLFSGRVPYEIITKTIRLGCPVIISPGAPTNLSVDLAKRYGITLIGFAKKGQFNVYSHPERVYIEDSHGEKVYDALTLN